MTSITSPDIPMGMHSDLQSAHPQLTRWLLHVRKHVLGASQLAISSVEGAPSQSQVSRAETDPDFLLTPVLLRSLGVAYHALAPNQFSDQAPSLVEAKAAAYAAAEPPADDRERQSALWEASVENPGKQLLLGIDLATQEMITGTSLRLAQPVEIIRGKTEFTDHTDMYMANAAADACAEFDDHVYRIAAWFNGVTIVEDSAPALGAMIAYWKRRAENHQLTTSVHRDISKRIDPIAGIRTLPQAVAAASELAPRQHIQTPTTTDHVAWILLIANMIGAREGISPIEAWEKYRSDSSLGVWAKLFDQLDSSLTERLPSLHQILATAKPMLNPWCPDSPTDGWDIGWTQDAEGNPIWNVSPPDDRARISPAAGDLLVSKPGEDLKVVESVLRRQQIPSATVEPAAAIPARDRHLRLCGIRLNSVADTAPYAWAPTGLKNSSYGLLRNEITKQWRAAQLF
ncbi:hypothetical protein [Mycobacteroides abscessus]|uniref:hypothetical protein n=1 Tax=Mycobacteroides abscessus TaxID=36809 RepID=UPI0010425644|nr:hypothetical protein [Mycobacteroides abscessus]